MALNGGAKETAVGAGKETAVGAGGQRQGQRNSDRTRQGQHSQKLRENAFPTMQQTRRRQVDFHITTSTPSQETSVVPEPNPPIPQQEREGRRSSPRKVLAQNDKQSY